MPTLRGNRNQQGYTVLSGKARFIFTNLKDKANDSVVQIYGSAGTTLPAGGSDGCELAQGMVNIVCERLVGYPWTTSGESGVAGNWGGAPDVGLRIKVYNYAANTTAYGEMRGIDLEVRNYKQAADTRINTVKGLYISAVDRNNYAGGDTIGNIVAAHFICKAEGTVATMIRGLIVEDTSGGSAPLTSAGGALVELKTTGTSRANGAVPAAIYFNKAGTNGFTNTFAFKSSDGSEGAFLYAGTITGSGNSVRILIDVAGTSYYLIARATVDH